MANSPAHRFGQIIGYYFESSIARFLSEFSLNESGFFVDRDGPRKARGTRKSVKWADDKGNEHKLDYVVERGGTQEKLGELAGIIEIAWRSYTKHSKNKVQEIEGAVNPVVRKHANSRPFKAAILAGDFTQPSLEQLRSHGFDVVYFDKRELAKVFNRYGINILIKDESDDQITQAQIDAYESLSEDQKLQLSQDLEAAMRPKMSDFTARLRSHLKSTVSKIYIAHHYSQNFVFNDLEDAIQHIKNMEANTEELEFSEFLIVIEFTSGTRIDIRATSKEEAVNHLSRFMSMNA